MASPLANALRDRYTLERELGRGGMATVYLAQDVRHARLVALKVLRDDLSGTIGAERFLHEIRITARLDHPHILPVLDSGAAAGRLWYTMPYVEGETLRERLRREPQLPLDEALRITRELADALGYAHEHAVVHRDVKPENVLLSHGHARMADFGVARALEAAGVDRLTETGLALGTPAYMSPEQAVAERTVDARSDQYSLACVLYEMLGGEPPYTGATAQAVIAKSLCEPVPHLGTLRAVPAGVDKAVRRGLAKSPADRYSSVAEFARVLEATPTATREVGPSGLLRRPTGSRPTWALLAVVVLVGLAMLYLGRRSTTTDAVAVAVLPFENLGDSADGYFADGVAEAVRGKLAAIPTLRVTARSSSNQYRSTSKTPSQIGKELGVQYLLLATVRWQKAAGESRVQVTPELVSASSGSTRWQQPFEARLTDVFAVQAEVAGKVAEALNVALGATTHRQLVRVPTIHVSAYDAFLRGEAASQGMSATDKPRLRRAVAAYEEAVGLDSTYLEAWAQLARARSILYYLGPPTPELAEATRHAAVRAATLGPARPEGHRAMSAYYANVTRDIHRAFAEDSAALLLGPVDADLLVAVARKEMAFGRWDASLAHLQEASRLDPRSVVTATRRGYVLFWLRRYREAQQAYDVALDLVPTDLASYGQKASIFVAQGDTAGARAVIAVAARQVDTASVVAYCGGGLAWLLDEALQARLLRLSSSAFDDDRGDWGLALAEALWLRGDRPGARAYADSARLALEQQLRFVPDDAGLRIRLSVALAFLGRRAEAIREGERGVALVPVTKDAIEGVSLQNQLLQTYILSGESEAAVDRLEHLLAMPGPLSPAWLRVDPLYAPLRDNPRFKRLVSRDSAAQR